VTSERANVPRSPNEWVDAWLQAATQAERQWNEYFNQVMGTEAYAQQLSRQMEDFTRMQASFARGMEQYLRSLNIPTQSDLAKLAERITALERRVDSLTADRES
jgi:polyhydroxyalkanoate synthesis regulator phasin